MKQTNGALTLLLKAYRSVFKAAYIKGLASAVILTAGLSAGVTNAADLDKSAFGGIAASGSVTVNGVSGTGTPVTEFENLTITENATNDNNFTITITSGNAADDGNYVSGSSAATLSGANGSIIIDIKGGTTADAQADGLLLGGTEAGNLDVKNVAINRGILKVDNGSVKADTLSIGSKTSAVANLDDIDAILNLASGTSAGELASTPSDADSYEQSSTINLNHGGKIVVNDESAAATNVTLNSGKLSIKGGAILFNESSTNASALTIKTATGTMEDGYIGVSSGDKVTLELQGLKSKVNDPAGELVEAKFTATGGTINVAGTLELHNNAAASGGVVDFSNDALTLISRNGDADDGATALSGTGEIKVSGAATGVQMMTLKISNKNLTEFLTDDDTGNADNKGKVTLEQNAILEFSDERVDLGALTFGTGAGEISVAQPSSQVKGNTFVINNALEGDFSGSIVANNLELGSNIKALSGSASEGAAKNASGYTVYEDLDINATDFTIDDTIQLGKVDDDDTTDVIEDTIAGSLTGNNVTVAAGVTIKGNYSINTTNLKLSGGSINVGNGELANVTVGGTVQLQNATTATTITVSGDSTAGSEQKAILDLTRANIVEDSGLTEVVQFKAEDNGTILIGGSNLTTLVSGANNDTSGAAFVVSGGILEANSAVTVKVQNLISGDGSNVSGNTIRFVANTDSIFKVDGQLTLQAEDLNSNKLNIGNSGSIVADSLNVNFTGTLNAETDDTFTVSAGNIQVLNQLTTNVDEILFDGQTNTSTLDLGEAENDDFASVTGSVTKDLRFSGSNAELNVNDGTWAIQDLTLDGGATATIGQTSFNDANEDNLIETTFTGKNLTVTGASSALTVNKTANATFNAISVATGTVKVDGGSLTINGADYSADNDTTNALEATYGISGVKYDALTVDNHGRLTFTGYALAGMMDTANASDTDSTKDGFMHTTTENADGTTTTDVDAYLTSGYGKITIDNGGILGLDYDSSVTLTKEEYVALKEALVNGSSLTGNVLTSGYIDIGDAGITGFTDQIEADGTVSWKNIKDLSDLFDLRQSDMMNAVVDGFTANDSLGGNFGAVNADEGVSSIPVSQNSSLNNASANNGNFISYGEAGNLGNADVKASVELQLNNGGNIGNVTLTNSTDDDHHTTLYVDGGADGVTNIKSVISTGVTGDNNTAFITASGTTKVAGNVNVGYYEVGGNDEVAGTIDTDDLSVIGGSLAAAGSISTEELWLEEGGALASTGANAAQKTITTTYAYIDENSALSTGTLNVTLGNEEAYSGEYDGASKVLGYAEVDNLTLSYSLVTNPDNAVYDEDEFQVANGGTVIVNDTLTVNSAAVNDVVIRVGLDAVEDDPVTEDINEARDSSNGFLYANTLVLNGASIIIDPDYTVDASVGAFDKLSAAPAAGSLLDGYSAGTLDGNLTVGQNAFGLIGTGSVEESAEAAAYVKTLGFDSALVLNKTVTVDTTKARIIVDPTRSAEEIDDATAEALAANPATAYGTSDLVLEENGALIVTGNAIEGADVARVGNATVAAQPNAAVISFANTNDAQIGSYGGEVIITDGYDVGDTIHLFSDGDGAVSIAGDQDLVVRTLNNLLVKNYEVGSSISDVNLEVNFDEAKNILRNASTPVYNTLMQYAARDLYLVSITFRPIF